MQRIILSLLAVLFVLVGASPAQAQVDYTPDEPGGGLTIEAVLRPDGVLTGSGNANPNEEVTILVNGEVLGVVTADGSGRYDFAFRLPDGVEMPLDVTARTATDRASVTLTGVTDPTGTNATGTSTANPEVGSLPRTGSNLTGLAIAAWVSIVVGLCFVFGARAMRARASQVGTVAVDSGTR